MISLLRGTIAEKKPGNVIIDVNGVGYGVTLPLSVFYKLGEYGEKIELKIYTHFRENSLELFGFTEEREKELFTRLLGISGIGPKAATNILSNISAEDLVVSIKSGDLIKKKIPGIGPKTAARIVTELKDKVAELSGFDTEPRENSTLDDIVSALLNLGYTKGEIDENLGKIENISTASDNMELALRDSIKIMKK